MALLKLRTAAPSTIFEVAITIEVEASIFAIRDASEAALAKNGSLSRPFSFAQPKS